MGDAITANICSVRKAATPPFRYSVGHMKEPWRSEGQECRHKKDLRTFIHVSNDILRQTFDIISKDHIKIHLYLKLGAHAKTDAKVFFSIYRCIVRIGKIVSFCLELCS